MATAKKPEKAVEAPKAFSKKVRVKLFKDNDKYKAPVFVGINGKTWYIPRGVEVEVPVEVQYVLENSEDARMIAVHNIEKSGMKVD